MPLLRPSPVKVQRTQVILEGHAGDYWRGGRINWAQRRSGMWRRRAEMLCSLQGAWCNALLHRTAQPAYRWHQHRLVPTWLSSWVCLLYWRKGSNVACFISCLGIYLQVVQTRGRLCLLLPPPPLRLILPSVSSSPPSHPPFHLILALHPLLFILPLHPLRFILPSASSSPSSPIKY